MPERLPDRGRVRFDAVDFPATEDHVVGGDWYDAFALPDGRIGLSIGDVTDRGSHATTVMREVRQALRAEALGAASPAAVLERANAIVNLRRTPINVTAIFGVIDPGTATITYAAAGHPAPVIALPCTLVEHLPAGGLPLGVAGAVGAVDWSFTIPPGASLAFSTDGTSGRDPAAALRVIASDEPSADLTFAFSAIPLAVPIVRRTLQRFVTRLGIDEDRVYALLTAVGEATANAVEHAYATKPGIVRLRAASDGAILHVQIEDDGRWKPPEVSDERGRGLLLMRALMDDVEIRTGHSRTSIEMTLALHAGPSAEA